MARVTKADWRAFDNDMDRWERAMWVEAEGLVAQLGHDNAEAEIQRRIAGAAEEDLFHLRALARSIAHLRTAPNPFKARH